MKTRYALGDRVQFNTVLEYKPFGTIIEIMPWDYGGHQEEQKYKIRWDNGQVSAWLVYLNLDPASDNLDALTSYIDYAIQREENDDHLPEQERQALVNRFVNYYKNFPDGFSMQGFPHDGSLFDKFWFIIS